MSLTHSTACRTRGRPALRGLALLAATVLSVTACSTSDPAAEENYYDGELVEIIVPFAAGGGTDLTARFFAPLLSKHLPGNPRVQVVNEEGANSLTGTNKFAAAEHDGFTLLVSAAGVTFNSLLANPDAQYSLADWTPLLAVPQNNIFYVSDSTGVTEPSELLDSPEPYVLPIQAVQGSDLVPVLSVELLDLDPQIITGYGGSGPARVAFEQGEANLSSSTRAAYKASIEPLVEAGRAHPMYMLGYFDADGEIGRDPTTPEIPHVGEVYETLHGDEPSGDMWEAYQVLLKAYAMSRVLWVHSDAPPEAVAALREAIAGIISDPEYEAGVEEQLEGYAAVTGDELTTVLASVMTPPQEALDWTYDYLRETHGIDIQP